MKVRLTFNDQPIEVEAGTLLIEAAKQAGCEIPHFCYHPKLKYDANCRMCIVEIEKMPKLQTSCSTVATEGMVVRSNTDRVKAAQNGVMAFLLGNHPLDCPECDQGGECQLQDFAHRYSPTLGRFGETKRRFEKEYFGPLIEKEMNRCVSCLRCVRYCDEVIGANALGSIDRGAVTEIGGFAHHPLDCEFCGGCIQICPVGALTSRASMYDYRPWQLKKTDTICTYCGDGCLLTLETVGEKVVRASSKLGVGRNEGDLCARGFFGYEFINHPERLTHPLIRQDEQTRQVTWEWAAKKAASDLVAIRTKYGSEAIAGLIGSHNTNEEIYLFRKLMREVLGTPHVDSSIREGYINAAKALTSVFGTTRLVRYEDIAQADLILAFAGDITETNPICAMRIKEAVRKQKTELMAIDSLNTTRDPYKSHLPHIAHTHLSIAPGTEGWVIAGMLKILAEKNVPNRRIPESFVERLRQQTAALSFTTIEEKSGVALPVLTEITERYAAARAAVVIVGQAILQNQNGFSNMLHLAHLALLADQVAKKGAGILPLAEKANELGLWENLYDVNESATSGATLFEIVDAIEAGKIRALYVVGQNPLRSFPQKRVREAFAKLDILICQDLFLTETAQAAHIVLPAASFAEKEGRYTNQEGEVQKLRKAIDPVGSSKPDWVIFKWVAEKLGTPFNYNHVGDIGREMLTRIPLRIFGQEAIQAKMMDYCNASESFVPSFASSSPGAVVDGEQNVFWLRLGSLLFHSGKLSTYSNALSQIVAQEALFMHPDDAERLGWTEGEMIEITGVGENGSVHAPLAQSRRLLPGTVFFPKHFSLEIKTGWPVDRDPMTHVPYGLWRRATLSKKGKSA